MSNVIGEGTYGCAHNPSLQCADNKMDYTNKISKILLASNAANEMKEYGLIDSADKNRDFYLGKPKKCKPKMDAETETAVKKCENKKLHSLPDTALLIMEDGGLNLKDYARQMSKKEVTPENRAKMEIFWIEMQRMLHALYVLEQNNLIHHDLKAQNIVYNESKQRMNLIDFGLMQKIPKVLKESKNSGYWLAYKMHWSFPFEIIYYNKRNFKIATAGNRDSRVANITKDLEKNKNHINIFFEDVNITTPYGKKGYMDTFVHLVENLQPEQYEEFITKSVSTIDVFGVGMAISVVFMKTYKFMPKEFIQDLSKIASEMFHPNVFLRLSPLAVLEKYEVFLEKHGLLKKHNMHIENHFLMEGSAKPIDIPSNIIHAKPISEAKMETIIDEMDDKLEKLKDKQDKPCKSGKERNPNGRCVSICKPGYRRDTNFKCVKSKTQKINPILKVKTCPVGKERNPNTNRCVTVCKPGYQRDTNFKCVKSKTQKIKPVNKKEMKEQIRKCIASCKSMSENIAT